VNKYDDADEDFGTYYLMAENDIGPTGVLHPAHESPVRAHRMKQLQS